MKLKLRGRPPSPRDYKGRTSNQARFLKAYARVGMIGVAAEMAGISRRSHVKWMHKEPAYPKLAVPDGLSGIGTNVQQEPQNRPEGLETPGIGHLGSKLLSYRD